mmetsp:Transcript_23057/g.48722  ORF Transcript_23057/g.48722 Transcript_23057/m.48722 type:complete len:302 (-) Transcript_23057:974-1879(-)
MTSKQSKIIIIISSPRIGRPRLISLPGIAIPIFIPSTSSIDDHFVSAPRRISLDRNEDRIGNLSGVYLHLNEIAVIGVDVSDFEFVSISVKVQRQNIRIGISQQPHEGRTEIFLPRRLHMRMSKDHHRPHAPAAVIRHILLDPLEIILHPLGFVSQIPAPHLIDPHEQDPISKKGEIGRRRRIDSGTGVVVPPIIVLDVDGRIAQGAEAVGIFPRIDSVRLFPVPKAIHPVTQRQIGIVAVVPIVVPDQEEKVSRIVMEGVAGMGEYLGDVGVDFLFAVFGLSGFDVADVDEEEKVFGLGV